MLAFLRQRRVTNFIRFLLDECLPPVLRDRRWLVRLIARVYCGKGSHHFDVDFKRNTEGLSQRELARWYQAAAGMGSDRVRESDVSSEEQDEVLSHLSGKSVLEVGAGAGHLARAIAATGRKVVAVDLQAGTRPGGAGNAVDWSVAFADRLPFGDGSFDTVVAAHTLEHVVDFEAAVNELRRVTRQRLIIVVPKQRYYRYTVDYHLHFFPDREQLILRVGLPHYQCRTVTGDLFYVGYLNGAGVDACSLNPEPPGSSIQTLRSR